MEGDRLVAPVSIEAPQPLDATFDVLLRDDDRLVGVVRGRIVIEVPPATDLGVLECVVGEVARHAVTVPLRGALRASVNVPWAKVISVAENGEVELEV
jgi:hypothetical protein